jgi:hypothetical protein
MFQISCAAIETKGFERMSRWAIVEAGTTTTDFKLMIESGQTIRLEILLAPRWMSETHLGSNRSMAR